MDHAHVGALQPQPGPDLHHASRIGRTRGIGVDRAHRGDLVATDRSTELGVGKPVDAGAAAALLGTVDDANLDSGNRAEDLQGRQDVRPGR